MTVMKIRDDMSPAQLRKLARRERDSRVVRRLLGIAAALDGMSREAAAKLAGVGRQILRDWVVRYNAEGVEGLRDEPRCGRPARLSAEERAGLKAMVLSPPDPSGPSRWRIVDLQQMIETRWGVRYSESGLWRLLQSLDLSLQKPRPIHPEANLEAQAAFKKTSRKSSQPSNTSTPKPAGLRSGFRMKRGSGRKAA